ncbi:DUF6226 family protein [Microbacterium sp. HD4P20]|uniref:DUF6226 family protein n=1 Tax=Microbacterium sp. HD4P20 TaxID=2864874 RepID=UPI001C63D99E|nr:DUF6226 family protein [Microbacterium sp. HD4P20]MCP2638211.1 DUF6226 family protein [Microbacterium sp. HD4P20]
MAEYVRPAIAAPPFLDDEGRPYGDRRADVSPPEDWYSVVSHPERFAPLHTVGDYLIEWLVDEFDAVTEESPEVAGDFLSVPPDAVRAVRVTPGDEVAAPLTFVFTSFPGIHLHAGFLFEDRYPSCGCDACDEEWESTATELERAVGAVVGGGFSEGFAPGAELPVSFRLERPDGWRGGSSRADAYPAELLARVGPLLTPSRAWAPWPRRVGR